MRCTWPIRQKTTKIGEKNDLQCGKCATEINTYRNMYRESARRHQKINKNNKLRGESGGARSSTSLVISSVWKAYMKHNCKLDDLGTGFEIAEG